jgi:hypothetical protein
MLEYILYFSPLLRPLAVNYIILKMHHAPCIALYSVLYECPCSLHLTAFWYTVVPLNNGHPNIQGKVSIVEGCSLLENTILWNKSSSVHGKVSIGEGCPLYRCPLLGGTTVQASNHAGVQNVITYVCHTDMYTTCSGVSEQGGLSHSFPSFFGTGRGARVSLPLLPSLNFVTSL